MKTLLTTLAVLTVALTAAAQQPTTAAQQPTTAPMKMGLWEAKGIVNSDTPSKQERIVRSCITPDNWLKMMGPTGPGACPKINEVWTKDNYSFDVQCSGKPKLATVSVHFIDPSTDHVIFDMYTTPSGEPLPTKMHNEADSHWVSESCGDLSPKGAVIVR